VCVFARAVKLESPCTGVTASKICCPVNFKIYLSVAFYTANSSLLFIPTIYFILVCENVLKQQASALGTSRNNATAAARICRECLSKRPPNNKIFRRENRRIRKEKKSWRMSEMIFFLIFITFCNTL
jgi:hypothetical protein